jgi:hypothetical protein
LIDPNNSLRIYAASGASFLNPGGVYVSDNGGTRWNSISIGLPGNTALALALKGSTLYAGTSAGVAELTRVADGDADGAATATEQTAFAGGDSNGDGIQDDAQANVATGVINTTAPNQRATSGGSSFGVETQAANAGAPVGSCEQIYDVQSVPPEYFAQNDQVALFPAGAFRFEIADCSAATVKLRFDTPLRKDVVLQAYGPTQQGNADSFAWFSLPASLSADRRILTFTLTDAQLGDARLDTNRILFQGGPAYEMFVDGFED